MIKLPKEFTAQYSKFLKDQGVEQRLQSFYLKWLRYYLDFCTKYSFKWSEKDSLPAFLIKLKSKNQKPFMLKQAEDAILSLWKMKNSEELSKQQTKPPDDIFSSTKDQVAKDSRVKHAAIVTKQTTEVMPETGKDAEKHKGAWQIP